MQLVTRLSPPQLLPGHKVMHSDAVAYLCLPFSNINANG